MTHLRPIIVAVLLSVSAIPVIAADPMPQPGAQTGSAGTPVSPLAEQRLDRLSATRDRPLFSPTRRAPAPPPVIPVAPPPPPSPPNVALLAVVMDGEEARAVVRAGPEAKIMRVQIGDDIGGWKVGQIEAQRLVLSLDDRTATFMMFVGNSASGPPNTGAAAQSSGAQSPNSAQPSSRSSNAAASSGTEFPQAKRPHRQR